MRTSFRNIFSLPGGGGPVFPADVSRFRRGSALLIVLGFLSFMMISGVSFAIYMRIERQASSNYRHSTTARHLLNAGLYRAIDEIDSELRVKSDAKVKGYTSIPQDSGSVEVKFPKWKDWPGRVKASAVDDENLNGENARVLSLESLSFLPAFLINDVRRFAVWDEDKDADATWRGAKWRTLTRATDGERVGRYAYVCVNVSDMLNVNLCRAQYRDSYTNRVTVGHLMDEADRQGFDDDVADDVQYFSVQDFYSARYARDKTTKGSPYHYFLNDATPDFSVFERPDNLDHLFSTDSIVRPDPVIGDACNLILDTPVSVADLGTVRLENLTLNNAFKTAMQQTFNPLDNNYLTKVMPFLIADYLDTDSIPKVLNVPSVEMVPMISQIVIDNTAFSPKIVTSTRQVGDPAHPVTVYSVQLFGRDPTTVAAPIYVELVWPFKYHKARLVQPAFTVEVQAYVQLHANHANKTTTSFQNRSQCIQLTQAIPMTVQKSDTWNKTITTAGDCCFSVQGLLQANRDAVTKDIIDTDGNLYNGFVKDQEFSVSLIVFAQVKSGGNTVVDRVPQSIPYPGALGLSEDAEFSVTPKLFFQTSPRKVQATMSATPLDFEWTSLEVADPRFNYRASNWVKNNQTVANYVGVNPSTTALLGQEGRDADIFMTASDAGYLQSPGELGFIIRPFPYAADTVSWDFRSETEPKDKDYMFRTIRLYDHGQATGDKYKQDEIYSHFYMMNRDGTLPGARVNPLSDIPEVLEGAIFNTPLDYWLSSTNNALPVNTRKNYTFNKDSRHFNGNVSQWESFRDAWSAALIKAVTEPVPLGSRTAKVNQEYKSSLSDVYGKWDVFKWYSDNAARTAIFGSLTLPAQLHEIDRKMLYSFSLDSFSDRQQLFLFFLRAEATVPSFGSSGQRSLAGGRAVALVWRDPYPRGYKKENDLSGSANPWLRKTGNNGWYPDLNEYTSPWCQYYDARDDSPARWDSYHDTRILFFKQLEQ